MSRKVETDIELILEATIDGHEVTFTGGLIYHLMNLYNTVDHFYLIVDIMNGTGHYIATSVNEAISLTKLDLKTFEDVLSGIKQLENFRILTETDLYPILNQLSNDQLFLTGLVNVNTERKIREIGKRAYRETQYINAKRGWSYSVNSDPNIRRYNVEQAYRRMLKKHL